MKAQAHFTIEAESLTGDEGNITVTHDAFEASKFLKKLGAKKCSSRTLHRIKKNAEKIFTTNTHKILITKIS